LENYIVRIYRRDSGNPFEIAGIVESVEDEKKQAFKNMNELSQILRSPEEKRPSRKKKRAKKE
jgi:hypothetical protein